jgi:hypothetical protein
VKLEAIVVKFVQQERINHRKDKRFVYTAHQESITMKKAQLPVKNVPKEDLRQRKQEQIYALIANKDVANQISVLQHVWIVYLGNIKPKLKKKNVTNAKLVELLPHIRKKKDVKSVTKVNIKMKKVQRHV